MEGKVLVVDDEIGICKAIRAALERLGLQVATALEGSEALFKFRRDPYDLVITDLKMPGMSGMDLLREIKRLSPRTPVVLLTAYGTVEGAVQAMKEGAFDFIQKPFSLEVLREVVFKALYPKEEVRKVRRIITQNHQMLHLLEMAKEVAKSSAPVLITGESGTGKELLARYIHEGSPRANFPFVAINCAALPEGLLESELFGYERGAFTGAVAQKKGKFELANGGTILLDEISEMPLSLQAKLLRVLQEGEIDRLGGLKPIRVDVRPIATSNCDLLQRIKEGKFREDLYFRLNVVHLRLPPLRERKEDIPLLAEYFLERYSRLNQKHLKGIEKEAMKKLMEYHWPGNVRELENVIHRAVLLAKSDLIRSEEIILEEIGFNGDHLSPRNLKELEKALILETLRKVNWNKAKAAKLLGITARTIRNKLKEYGIDNGSREKGGKDGAF